MNENQKTLESSEIEEQALEYLKKNKIKFRKKKVWVLVGILHKSQKTNTIRIPNKRFVPRFSI